MLTFIAFIVILSSCAPVLNKTYLNAGDREVSFNALRQNPGAHKGKLYVFGGVVVGSRLTEEGSQVEALDVPVDRYGHFREEGLSQGRFLALLPQDQGMLDPEVYKQGRRITIAAEFMDLRKSKVDEMEYSYPVFLIRQIYLWPRERAYYPAYYYDPWFYPYPYYYWNPWWSYPYYYYYDYRYWSGPIYRRVPPVQPPPAGTPSPPLRRGPSPDHGIDRAPAPVSPPPPGRSSPVPMTPGPTRR
jgi:outer membrane lipoprotein